MYENGLKSLLDEKKMVPMDRRVVLKAILRQSELYVGNEDKNKHAICYEVWQVGPLVKTLKEGMHCLHISAAGDSEGAGVDQEYRLVHERDVVVWWNPPY